MRTEDTCLQASVDLSLAVRDFQELVTETQGESPADGRGGCQGHIRGVGAERTETPAEDTKTRPSSPTVG